MFTGFDLDGLRRGVNLGAETALGLQYCAQRIGAAGTAGGRGDRGSSAMVLRIADHVFAVSSDIGTRVRKLEAMLATVHDQHWIAPLFANDADLMYSLLALAGLTEGEVLRTPLGDIINHVHDLSADRDWMESLSVEDRRRWNALLGVRWLDEVNARGANNCFDGVLHFFQDTDAITPGSFASIVDAQILCAFQDGIANALHRAITHKPATGSTEWSKFFARQQSLPPGAWDNASVDAWTQSEQAATEAGYRWADRRGADPTARVAVMALGAEAFRWLNRQRGADSDPLALAHAELPGFVPIPTDIPAGVLRMLPPPAQVMARLLQTAGDVDPHVLFDPRQPNFTYLGAKALDDLARPALIAQAQDPAAPQRIVPMSDFKTAAAVERRALDVFGAEVALRRNEHELITDPVGSMRHGAATASDLACHALSVIGASCS
jgi:hypothetical protein